MLCPEPHVPGAFQARGSCQTCLQPPRAGRTPPSTQLHRRARARSRPASPRGKQCAAVCAPPTRSCFVSVLPPPPPGTHHLTPVRAKFLLIKTGGIFLIDFWWPVDKAFDWLPGLLLARPPFSWLQRSCGGCVPAKSTRFPGRSEAVWFGKTNSPSKCLELVSKHILSSATCTRP